MKNLVTSILAVTIIGSSMMAHAQNKFPLRVDIDVSTKSSKRNIGSGSDGSANLSNVQVIVKVRKSSSEPWTKPVGMELYVIGKQIQTGYYGIIDVQKGEFAFNQEDDYSFIYKSPTYTLGRTSGNINVGGIYETYLVVVTDQDGEIVATRSGRHIQDKGIAFIRELGPLTLFDRDGNILGKADASAPAFRAAVPAAVGVYDN
ncbi:hypothetical protein P4E94_13390 [Pontiellaceae bacterium B12219]|nr:hypothetical protein [Pontiellaceae bacterium B12219]